MIFQFICFVFDVINWSKRMMSRLTVVQHGADVLLELEGLVLVGVLPLQRLLAPGLGLTLNQGFLQLGRHLWHLATGILNIATFRKFYTSLHEVVCSASRGAGVCLSVSKCSFFILTRL